MEGKFVNIQIKGESNIGVIDLGEINYKLKEANNKNRIKCALEPKLVEALQSHFDCEVKIIYPHVISINPIEIKVDVIICGLDEDHQEEVILNETWLY